MNSYDLCKRFGYRKKIFLKHVYETQTLGQRNAGAESEQMGFFPGDKCPTIWLRQAWEQMGGEAGNSEFQ